MISPDCQVSLGYPRSNGSKCAEDILSPSCISVGGRTWVSAVTLGEGTFPDLTGRVFAADRTEISEDRLSVS